MWRPVTREYIGYVFNHYGSRQAKPPTTKPEQVSWCFLLLTKLQFIEKHNKIDNVSLKSLFFERCISNFSNVTRFKYSLQRKF